MITTPLWSKLVDILWQINIRFAALSCVFNESRIVRGSRLQKMGAISNLVAYYAVGIPVSLVFGFGLNFYGKGL